VEHFKDAEAEDFFPLHDRCLQAGFVHRHDPQRGVEHQAGVRHRLEQGAEIRGRNRRRHKRTSAALRI
jgi:hypothetical protein